MVRGGAIAVGAAILLGALLPASAGAQLAGTTWCGTQTEANNPDVTSAPRLKYVYAYPADQPNRFDLIKNQLQSDAVGISDLYTSASGGRKTLRWDVGTSCGNQYLDIEVVRLPRNRSEYHPSTNAAIERARSDLRAAIDPAPGRRNYAVILDFARDHTAMDQSVLGIANAGDDDKPGMVNSANRGDRMAIAFGDTSNNFQPPSTAIPGGLTHELTHTFGAVNNSAPHSDQFGHATDGRDLLGSGSTQCPAPASFRTLDCNGDDYFNPTPAPGSYLATHWNIYDVVFLVPPDQLTAQAAAPVAGLAGMPSGNNAALDASGSTDADGVITKYEWDAGADGSFETNTTTAMTTIPKSSNGRYAVRVTDEDGLTGSATITALGMVAGGPGGGPGMVVPVDIGLKSTKTSQKLKDALKKGVLAKAKPNMSGKLTLTLYKGKKKLKSVKVNAVAGKSVSKRIKPSSKNRKKYLKKGTFEIRASLKPTAGGDSVTAKLKVKLK